MENWQAFLMAAGLFAIAGAVEQWPRWSIIYSGAAFAFAGVSAVHGVMSVLP